MGKEDAVKRKRFSVEQIVAVLKQAEMGIPVADLIRHLAIAEQTFYRRKQSVRGECPVDGAGDSRDLRQWTWFRLRKATNFIRGFNLRKVSSQE
jgi:putative transposase